MFRCSGFGIKFALAFVLALVCVPSSAVLRDPRAAAGQKPPPIARDTTQRLKKEMAGRKAFAPVASPEDARQSAHRDYHEPKLPTGGDAQAVLAITTKSALGGRAAAKTSSGGVGSRPSILLPILVLLAIPAAAFVAVRRLGCPPQPRTGPLSD